SAAELKPSLDASIVWSEQDVSTSPIISIQKQCRYLQCLFTIFIFSYYKVSEPL
ncbi:MAG: hypothetical protein ACI8TV_001467, partial [Porticoccaceae bacterium]